MKQAMVMSSESVTAGHPDKLCDQISDAIVDRYLRQDRAARVAAECAISTGILFVSVKAHARATIDAPAIAREILRDAGYISEDGFDPRACTVVTSLQEMHALQLPRLDEEGLDERAVDALAAHDQAMVVGFACDDTPQAMPLPIVLAHALARRMAELTREDDALSPDGKTQVAIEYRDARPARIDGITLVASQRYPQTPSANALRAQLLSGVVKPVLDLLGLALDERTRLAVNPEGPIVPGGPVMHAGLTGRKLAVDCYGDFARHGAAALSGKDPSRIDRVGAYAARHAARNLVAAGLARRCEVQLTYSIGQALPVSVLVNTAGTGRLPDPELAARVARVFDFRPAAIVRRFQLRSAGANSSSFYRRLASYGQVGRTDLDLPWERLDHTEQLRA